MATKLPKKKSAAKKASGKKPSPQPTGGNPMRDLQRLMAKQNFQSMEDIEAFMTEISKGPIPEIEPEDDNELAEDLVYRSMELDDDDARELLDEALMIDPECVAAFAALGQRELNPSISLAFYERGMVIAGVRFLSDEYLKENVGHFWMIYETRPFMQCLQGAADSHFFMGRLLDAIMIWMKMISLNPNDNQGIRNDLMLALAVVRDTEEFEKLDARFKDDASAATLFNRVLLAFTTSGPGPRVNKLLEEAVRSNAHIVPLLLKDEPERRRPTTYTFGSKEEAYIYLDKGYLLWRSVPGVMDWLSEVAPKKKKK